MIDNRTIPGPGGDIPVRHYRPAGASAETVLPALLYFHGGGWTIGDLDTHDTLCRELANLARCAVLSVDYRMGPEHKFPAAVDDAHASFRWLVAQSAALRMDPARIAVGGDSAGANLATVVALIARDEGGTQPCFQLLIYPATEHAFATASHQAFAQGYLLTRESMRWFMGNYLRDERDALDWRASPARAPRLDGLPRATVMTAGFDPLRDEGKAYAERLADSGVDVAYRAYPGMIHGFIMMGGVLDTANDAVHDAAADLTSAFARGGH